MVIFFFFPFQFKLPFGNISIKLFVCCMCVFVPVWGPAAFPGNDPPRGSGKRQAMEDAAGLLKVLLRERLAAVPDRLGMKGQMVFD